MICLLCKNSFKRENRRKYCYDCTRKYLGRTMNGRSWVRHIARIRDKFTCQDCGFIRTGTDVINYNNKIEGLKGRIKNLDIHHLNGLCGINSKGYDRIKDIDGLITLCHSCHYNRPEHKCKSPEFSQKIYELSNKKEKKFVIKDKKPTKVIALLQKGLTSKDIAEKLNINLEQVNKQIVNYYK